jgi:hypothetical protein
VIQPERRTSATPAIVASSIVGRVNGRNGSDFWGGIGGGRATALRGSILRGDTKSSRLVAEKIVARALATM